MLFLYSHHITDLYCVLDDLAPSSPACTGRPPALSQSEVLTMLVWNTLVLNQKTLKGLYENMKRYHGRDFPALPSYQAFVAHCHRALPSAEKVLQSLLKDEAPVRIMDATMLPVCKLARADHHKAAKNIAQFGKNWQGWHYGFKLHASIDLEGKLSGIFFSPANLYDAQAMPKILNQHCKLAVGDTLYGASVMGKRIRKEYGTVIIAPAWPKQNKKVCVGWELKLLDIRSKIEAVFDYLKEHLHLVSSFPRSVNGYFVHYISVLLGYQVGRVS
jgi:hypothetical protein